MKHIRCDNETYSKWIIIRRTIFVDAKMFPNHLVKIYVFDCTKSFGRVGNRYHFYTYFWVVVQLFDLPFYLNRLFGHTIFSKCSRRRKNLCYQKYLNGVQNFQKSLNSFETIAIKTVCNSSMTPYNFHRIGQHLL